MRSDDPDAADPAAPDPAAPDASRPVRALVVADGEPIDAAATEAAWPGWADGIALVVAADGGARLAERLVRSLGDGRRAIDLIVGDGDSLGEEQLSRFEAAGVPVERSPAEKDESDTELAVRAALARGATDVVIVGAVGGRLDHTVANLSLLAAPALAGRSCAILDSTTRVTLLSGPAERDFVGRAGDIVSLLPLGDGVTGVKTDGLAYPLRDERLPFGPARGLSNVRTTEVATVSVRTGRLLVVETPATLPA
ncbi:MAG TPA: thiamine diphosphokinase [Candidatus Binatia bacterium]|nr:thiamine diphosphokinase [Candidatus Binatia bacterium]